MKKGLVNIAQGTPAQVSRVKRFLLDSKEIYPEKKLKTHADAIDFAIEQAQKVPELENQIREQKKRIEELEKETKDIEFTLEEEYVRQTESDYGDE